MYDKQVTINMPIYGIGGFKKNVRFGSEEFKGIFLLK